MQDVSCIIFNWSVFVAVSITLFVYIYVVLSFQPNAPEKPFHPIEGLIEIDNRTLFIIAFAISTFSNLLHNNSYGQFLFYYFFKMNNKSQSQFIVYIVFSLAVLLMGEPVNWEKSLQIIMDVLLSSGQPNKKYQQLVGNHIPIVAVNTDYLWMSEANNPRLIFFCAFLFIS